MTNKQPDPNQDSELLAKICEIFGVFPEELQYDLPGGIGTKKAEQLVSLIQTSVQEAEQEARIDELCKAFTQVVGDKSVSLRSKFVKRFDTYLKERHNQLKYSSKKEIDDSIKSPTGEIYYKQDTGVCEEQSNA